MTGVDPALSTQSGPEASLKGKNGANAAPKTLLSFGEEIEDAGTANSSFSLAKQPRRRYVRCTQAVCFLLKLGASQ